jgi:alkanesulfonate monooxygenase SsuD/methylene tetrahydromethanopterin reductase-like flavin-dependent oxidoreductase (luciferase family)
MPEAEDFTRPVTELGSDRFIIGSADECFEVLRPWRDEMGVNHFIFRTHWSGMPTDVALESMKILSDEVIPRLKTGDRK